MASISDVTDLRPSTPATGAASGTSAPAPAADLTALRERLLHPWPRISPRLVLGLIALALAYAWGLSGTRASPAELVKGLPNIADFVRRLMPPVWEMRPVPLQTPALPLPFGLEIPSLGAATITVQLPTVLFAIMETVQMAIIGTTLAVVLALPFGLLAARNTSPHRFVYSGTRLLLNANRAVPEIIFAFIFVSAVGLGPFGGVLALAIGEIGFMGKLYSEAIEAIDPAPVQAVAATGAGRMQTFVYGVIPQALPLVAAYALLLFERNVRAATILGIVGAGGAGFVLSKYMALFQYQRLMGALVLIIVVVTLIDRGSAAVRRRII